MPVADPVPTVPRVAGRCRSSLPLQTSASSPISQKKGYFGFAFFLFGLRPEHAETSAFCTQRPLLAAIERRGSGAGRNRRKENPDAMNSYRKDRQARRAGYGDERGRPLTRPIRMKSWKMLVSVTALSALAIVGSVVSAPTANATIPEPSTSPGVQRIWVGSTANTNQCSTGYLCAYVPGNSNHGGWWEFKFFYCGVYNLSYWHGYTLYDSFVIDDQTGGVTTSYYGGYNGTGAVLQRMTPRAGQFQDILPGTGSTHGWNPIYSIRVC